MINPTLLLGTGSVGFSYLRMSPLFYAFSIIQMNLVRYHLFLESRSSCVVHLFLKANVLMFHDSDYRNYYNGFGTMSGLPRCWKCLVQWLVIRWKPQGQVCLEISSVRPFHIPCITSMLISNFRPYRLSGYVVFPLFILSIYLGGAWSHWSERNSVYIIRLLAFSISPIVLLAAVLVRVR